MGYCPHGVFSSQFKPSKTPSGSIMVEQVIKISPIIPTGKAISGLKRSLSLRMV